MLSMAATSSVETRAFAITLDNLTSPFITLLAKSYHLRPP